jgi:hypothetical protein
MRKPYAEPKIVTIHLFDGESPWQRGVELFDSLVPKSRRLHPHHLAEDEGQEENRSKGFGLDAPDDEYKFGRSSVSRFIHGWGRNW